MLGVVAQKPACRRCGTPVEPLHKCKGCGKRSILAFFLPRHSRW